MALQDLGPDAMRRIMGRALRERRRAERRQRRMERAVRFSLYAGPLVAAWLVVHLSS